MKTTLYPALLSMLLALASASVSHAEWGKIQIWDQMLPRFVDAETKELKVYGEVAGGPFSDIRMIATWLKTAPGQKNPVASPVLTPENGRYLKYSFPIGGTYCGLVKLHAVGKISDVAISTADEYVYVDCDPPQLTILKPQEGEVLKAGQPQVLELEIKDDALEQYKLGTMRSLFSDRAYGISVDLDGGNVSTNKYPIPQLAIDTNKKAFRLPPLQHGRHALRVTITDSTGKTDEKTLFIKADGKTPDVIFLSPYNNQQLVIAAGEVAAMKISVEVTDAADVSSGVEKVEFYVDGKGVGVVDTPTERSIYSVTVGVPEQGVKEISVKAYDKVGNVRQQGILVRVIHEGKAKPIGPVPTQPKTLPLPFEKKL